MITVGARGNRTACTDGYRCAGVHDERTIAAALAADPVVRLSGGRFTCSGKIIMPKGSTLTGTPTTILDYPVPGAWLIYATGANTIAHLTLTGGICVCVVGSDVRCSNLVSYQKVYNPAAFRVWARDGPVSDVAFHDCHAVDTSGHGFLLDGFWGKPASPTLKRILFARCTATNCGQSQDNESAKAWITGFNLAEGGADMTIEDVAVIDCRATNCWESGFHCECAPNAIGCRIVRCTATNNGTVKPDPAFAAGFLVPPGWTLADCVAIGNRTNYISGTHVSNAHANDLLTISRCQSIAPALRGFRVAGAEGKPFRNLVMDRFTAIGGPNIGTLINTTGARITNLQRIDCGASAVREVEGSAGNTITYDDEGLSVKPAPCTLTPGASPKRAKVTLRCAA